VPKAVKGIILSLLAYIVIFIIASFNRNVDFQLPGETIYVLLVYALVGCLGMVIVLPLLILKKK
jgi:hypothetical protein